MVNIKGVSLSYKTVKNYILNSCFLPELSKEAKKELIINGLTSLSNICYDIRSYYRDIQHDNNLDDDRMYSKDIKELGNLIAQIIKENRIF